MPIKCNFWKPVIPLSMGGQWVAEPVSNTWGYSNLHCSSLYSNSADSSAPSSGAGLAQLAGGKEEVIKVVEGKKEDRHWLGREKDQELDWYQKRKTENILPDHIPRCSFPSQRSSTIRTALCHILCSRSISSRLNQQETSGELTPFSWVNSLKLLPETLGTLGVREFH